MEQNLNDWVKGVMIDKLGDLEGRNEYVSDLPSMVFEKEDINGTYTFSRYEAQEWVKRFYDDLGEVYDNIKSEYGEVINPFDNAEAFQVQVMMCLANDILWNDEYYNKLNDENEDEIEFTEEILNNLVASLKGELEEEEN